MGFLQGKRVLVVGLASNRSIAWGVAATMHREGAELAFTYQNDKLRERVGKMAAELDSDIILPCDVGSDTDIEQVFEQLDDYWDHLDVIVHSVAYAPAGQLEGNYLDDVTREGFQIAHDISSYSFVALAKAGRRMLRPGSCLLTMSYLGAVRAVPHYNVMGLAKASLEANVRYMAAALGPEQIRVNAISAGPIKTLAAKGISDFNKLLDYGEQNSPLRRNVTIEEVGNAAAFLCSDLASGISGDVLYVDAGYHVQAMAVPQDE
ncbi:MAG: enoyl-[acyl-carrier-protein] reductase FabI [Gammaproteobacteria bacterium HGW-Gammaproteobacteria-1]|jgi:enoyl-[acyl-carrier protein] reductase I|nr:MAG: enoyl-[acyl-carrier-protein] reductase FabI [Gammaproteobacteria bacterium HGW-Gammaproteobacteria-1]